MLDSGDFLTRQQLAKRWKVQLKTVDRLRQRGLLPWMDLSGGHGKKSLVRFSISDVEHYESRNRMAPFESKEVHQNGAG